MVTKEEEGQTEVGGGTQSGKSIGPSVCKSQKQERLALCSCPNARRLSLTTMTIILLLQETKMNHG